MSTGKEMKKADVFSDLTGLTNIVDWAPSGVVTVTATPNPNAPPNHLPECWNVSGGTEVSKTVHTVPKSEPGFYPIIASAGTTVKTQVVVVVKSEFTLFGRCGLPNSGGESSSFLGHVWWALQTQPAQASSLVYPASGRDYVNRYVGYACPTCVSGTSPPSCWGPGFVWLDNDNGYRIDAAHTWNITFAQLQSGANCSAQLAANPPDYNCLYNNCVVQAMALAQSTGISDVGSCVDTCRVFPCVTCNWLLSLL